jgi:hypothetical protein
MNSFIRIWTNVELNQDKTEYTITPTAMLSRGREVRSGNFQKAPLCPGTDTVARQEEANVWRGPADAQARVLSVWSGRVVALPPRPTLCFQALILTHLKHVTIEPAVSGT